jgi:hypothetical protein
MHLRKLKASEADLKRSIRELCRINQAKVYSFYGGTNLPNGWPDLIVAYKGLIFFLEVKKPGGKMNAAQKKFKEDLEKQGIPYHVVSSPDEVVQICGFPSLLDTA